MIVPLTPDDRKILKYERRLGIVFFFAIVSFGAFFNLLYFVFDKENYKMAGVIILNSGTFFVAFVFMKLINTYTNRDLLQNTKEILTKVVDQKIEEKSYEAGSGNLYSPILGVIFPKLFSSKMRESSRYYLIIEGKKHEVDKLIFDQLVLGEKVNIHSTANAQIVLRIEKIT